MDHMTKVWAEKYIAFPCQDWLVKGWTWHLKYFNHSEAQDFSLKCWDKDFSSFWLDLNLEEFQELLETT